MKKKLKRGYQIGNTKIEKRGDSPVFEIDRWNFQEMLDLGFSETSQYLSSFKQLSFSLFHRGRDQRKKKTGESPLLSIFIFPIWYPLFIFIFWFLKVTSGKENVWFPDSPDFENFRTSEPDVMSGRALLNTTFYFNIFAIWCFLPTKIVFPASHKLWFKKNFQRRIILLPLKLT